jgi:hypothetical protein
VDGRRCRARRRPRRANQGATPAEVRPTPKKQRLTCRT